MKYLFLLLGTWPLWGGNVSYFSQQKWQILSPLSDSNKTPPKPNIRYYQNAQGKTVGVDNTILVQCVPHHACENDLFLVGVIDVEPLSRSLFTVTVDTQTDVFQCAKSLKNLPSVKHAHPNFIRRFEPR